MSADVVVRETREPDLEEFRRQREDRKRAKAEAERQQRLVAVDSELAILRNRLAEAEAIAATAITDVGIVKGEIQHQERLRFLIDGGAA